MKEKKCLNCKHGSYDGGQRVICSLYDCLVMENDNCGLWSDRNDL